MQRALRTIVAAVHRQDTGTCGYRRDGQPTRYDATLRWVAAGHVCRAAPLLLRRRSQARTDPLPEREGVRRHLAGRASEWPARGALTVSSSRAAVISVNR